MGHTADECVGETLCEIVWQILEQYPNFPNPVWLPLPLQPTEKSVLVLSVFHIVTELFLCWSTYGEWAAAVSKHTASSGCSFCGEPKGFTSYAPISYKYHHEHLGFSALVFKENYLWKLRWKKVTCYEMWELQLWPLIQLLFCHHMIQSLFTSYQLNCKKNVNASFYW